MAGMFDAGQLVRIRERVWQVLEDHAGHPGGDHTLRVRAEEGEVRGREWTFIYHPVTGDEDAFDEAGLEKVEALPSQWIAYISLTNSRLHMDRAICWGWPVRDWWLRRISLRPCCA